VLPIKSPILTTPDTTISSIGETRRHGGGNSPDFYGHGFEDGQYRMAQDLLKFSDIG
jgi:hypothetical protein